MIRFRARSHSARRRAPGGGRPRLGLHRHRAGPRHSTLQQQIGQPVDERHRAADARLRNGGTPGRHPGIRRRRDPGEILGSRPCGGARVLWKADGIPALYAAAFRPDPLAGGLDLWLLIVQMELYFTEGPAGTPSGRSSPSPSPRRGRCGRPASSPPRSPRAARSGSPGGERTSRNSRAPIRSRARSAGGRRQPASWRGSSRSRTPARSPSWARPATRSRTCRCASAATPRSCPRRSAGRASCSPRRSPDGKTST